MLISSGKRSENPLFSLTGTDAFCRARNKYIILPIFFKKSNTKFLMQNEIQDPNKGMSK